MFNGFREHKVTPDRAPSIPTPTPPEAGGAGKKFDGHLTQGGGSKTRLAAGLVSYRPYRTLVCAGRELRFHLVRLGVMGIG